MFSAVSNNAKKQILLRQIAYQNSLLRRGSRWVSQKNSKARGGRWEEGKGGLLCSLTPSHRPTRAFIFPLPSLPTTQKETSAEERATKTKLSVATHFSEIIELQFENVMYFEDFTAANLFLRRGWLPPTVFWILTAITQDLLLFIVITHTRYTILRQHPETILGVVPSFAITIVLTLNFFLLQILSTKPDSGNWLFTRQSQNLPLATRNRVTGNKSSKVLWHNLHA